MGFEIAWVLFLVGFAVDGYRITFNGEISPRYVYIGPVLLVALLIVFLNSDRLPTESTHRNYRVAKVYGDQLWLKDGGNYTFNPSMRDYVAGDRVQEICRKAPLGLFPDNCWIEKLKHEEQKMTTVQKLVINFVYFFDAPAWVFYEHDLIGRFTHTIGGLSLFTIEYDGTIEGFWRAMVDTRKNSQQVKIMTDFVLQRSPDPSSEDVDRIQDLVVKHGLWTDFSVVHSQIDFKGEQIYD